jgi:septal ring factor EnvC (AmiA/AmiB activator)
MTRACRIATALVVLVGAAASANGQQRSDINRRIQENQQHLDSIRREREQLQQQLRQLEGRAHTITAELDNIERQKSATSRIVNELDRQIGSLRSELDTVTLDLILTEDALAESHAVLEKRLAEIYMRGPLWTFQVLLAAESFGDLVSRYKYLYLVSRQDRALAASVEELRDRVATRRQELVVGHNELARQRDERSGELNRFTSLETRRQRALRDTRASQRTASTRVDSLARDEERVTDLIASLERDRLRAGVAGPGAITEASLGSLDWPVDGGILYRFGPQQGPDNTTIRQNGIGIRAPVGTPVRAVAGGRVEHGGPWGTYGPSVILSHGGGYYTLYLYLSRVDVRVNGTVQPGQVIGLSGGGSSDQGPHIEFQLRERGVALNPETWLRRRR